MSWRVGFADGSGAEDGCAHIVDQSVPELSGHGGVIVRGGSPEGDIGYGVLDPKNAPLIAAAPAMRDLLASISAWLVCAAIASPEDMAQSFDPFRKDIDALLDSLP